MVNVQMSSLFMHELGMQESVGGGATQFLLVSPVEVSTMHDLQKGMAVIRPYNHGTEVG